MSKTTNAAVNQPIAGLSIEELISPERLHRYLQAAGHDPRQARHLYEENIALAACLLGVFHQLEIGLRNSMDRVLTTHFQTARWFSSGVAPINAYGAHLISTAIRYAGGSQAPPGKVVAELTCGFWAHLVAREYHWTLWQPCLHQAFPFGRLGRRVIHDRLDRLARLRNRFAHHEPIITGRRTLYLGRNCTLSLDEIAECSEWISPNLKMWLEADVHFQKANEILSRLVVYGVRL